ncbi:hypothetical protein LAZ67_17000019 [Cordylochernes scorpioides]|uniref:Mariner Mos1 transposase n=1 Tax=Cordylochernes scorpioides TaxID=51811 RepID=A0ABY6LF69_9ARAC|nr:hypothetical protein LAZ67_17000019 [Cordylochernes scorpioides]
MWVHYDNPKCQATYGYPGRGLSSMAKPNIHGGKIMLCIWWDQLGVVYYELLQLNESITGEVYRRQLITIRQDAPLKRSSPCTQNKLYHDLADQVDLFKTWYREMLFTYEGGTRQRTRRRPIKFEDAELEALLDEDSSQTQEELAETLGVTQQAILNRLKVMGMVQKQGNWVPYELKPGNIERP